MDKRNCICIDRYWAFAGPTGDGGVMIGESPVGASGSGMTSMCPFRRAWQKEVGK